MKYQGEHSETRIGSRNSIREFVTIHRGTGGGGSLTSLGDDNLLQAYAHVAHDCHVRSHTILAHSATLGGHVTVEDWAVVGAHSGVHQFCRVGMYAFIGGYTVVTKDILPFSKTVGNRACLYGVNTIGLERHEFPRDRVEKIRWAFRVLQQPNLNVSQAMSKLELQESQDDEDVRTLIDFVRSSKRGVIVKRGREDTD